MFVPFVFCYTLGLALENRPPWFLAACVLYQITSNRCNFAIQKRYCIIYPIFLEPISLATIKLYTPACSYWHFLHNGVPCYINKQTKKYDVCNLKELNLKISISFYGFRYRAVNVDFNIPYAFIYYHRLFTSISN